MNTPMMPSMPWECVEEAFPFVFAWDDSLRLLRAGPSLSKIAADMAPGVHLQDVLDVERPRGTLSRQWLQQRQGMLVLLRHRQTGAMLRGQIMQLGEAGVVAFLGSPWLGAADELDRLGLTLADYPPHDSTQDLLHVVQSQRMSNEELHSLNVRLKAKQAQLIEKQAESRKLAMVAERTDNAVIVADRHGRIEWVNEAFERMTGWPMAEVLGKKPGSFLQGPRTDENVARSMGEKSRAGEGFRTEILNYRRDASPYWVDIEVQPIVDETGQLTHFMAIEAEVSEKKRQETRRQLETVAARIIASDLKRSEVIPAILKEIASQLHWVLGAWWTPDATGEHLILAGEWHGKTASLETFLDASREKRWKRGQGLPGRVWASGTSHWITDVRKDENFPRQDAAVRCGITAALGFPVRAAGELYGVVEFFSLHLDPPDPDLLECLNHIGRQLGMLMKRIEAEEALKERERALNEGQRLAHLGTWEWDLSTNALTWSDEKYRIYGFEPRSFAPTLDHVKRCVLAEDLPRFLEVLDHVAKTGPSEEVSYRVTRPDGEIRHVHTLAAADCGEDGRPFRLVGTMQDVTQAVAVEDAYKEAQRISHLGNWSIDLVNGAVRWSDEKYRIYGYEPGAVQVTLDFCKRSMHPDDVESVMAFIESVAASCKPMTTTYRIIRPDGEVRHLRCSAEARLDASGKAREVLGTALDITELVEAQRTLQETEERWQFALENNGLGVWDWNVVSGFVLYTDRLQQMLGYEPGEWPQHVDSWASRVHPDDMPSVTAAMNKCLGRETPAYICEHRLRCKDGSWKWVQDVGRIVSYTKDGKPLRMIGTQMDIHIRKQLEEASRRRVELTNRIRSAQEHFIGAKEVAPVFSEMLEVVVEHTRSKFGFIGEVLKDSAGSPYLRSYALTDIAWNEETRQIMTGKGPMGLEFRNLKTLFGAAMATGEVVIANDAANDPRRGGLPPGHPPIETFLGLPVFNGLEMVGLVGLANKTDGYDRESLKELDPYLAAVSSMIVARRETERRRQIEEELRTAKDNAEAASRAKSEFLAVMSHEIRTPMNGVLGMAGLLKASPLNARQVEMVDAVLHSGGALVHIIDDILDFAKIEASQIDLREQPVVLDELVEGVADLLFQEASSKGLELVTIISPDLPEVILGDQGRLRQVLLNLAGNAVKFTSHGHVTIRVTRAGDEIDFRVEDTGIGVPPEAQDRLFKPFSQVDSSHSRRFGGTGLGLAICKKLVGVMKGDIGFISRPGKGSQFWFRVPMVTRTRNQAGSATGVRGARCIWLAHASAHVRECIASMIAGPGVTFHELKRTQLAQEIPRLQASDDIVIADAAWLSRAKEANKLTRPEQVVLIQNGSESAAVPPGCRTVTLPLHRQALREAVWSRSKTPGSERQLAQQPSLGLRVLVAEDNRVNARLACLLLENLGCTPTVAVNGKEAVAIFQRQPFDAILMDCQMPIMDGHAATRKIRQIETKLGRRCKIIAMTASALPEERERCLASGMDEHLSKPFDASALVRLLEGINAGTTNQKSADKPATRPSRIKQQYREVALQIGQEEAAQLARLWLEEAPARHQRLSEALSHNDLATAQKEAHALRGSSAVFGMERLVGDFAALEALLKSGKRPPDSAQKAIHRRMESAARTLKSSVAGI